MALISLTAVFVLSIVMFDLIEKGRYDALFLYPIIIWLNWYQYTDKIHLYRLSKNTKSLYKDE